MQLFLDKHLAAGYKSPPQKIRVVTESWAAQEVFCPSCGSGLSRYESNRPVADFCCRDCNEEYELKSKRNGFGHRVVDGAYKTTIDRLTSNTNPSLFLLTYNAADQKVLNLLVIPKYFFVPNMLEERRPLSVTARRPGWIGCNFILDGIPQAGRIFYVKDGVIEPKSAVMETWKKTLFLKKETSVGTRAWILDVMHCVDKLGKREFSLDEVYSFEAELQARHPHNLHVKDKIRQQLQLLRDSRYLRFLGKGRYRLVE